MTYIPFAPQGFYRMALDRFKLAYCGLHHKETHVNTQRALPYFQILDGAARITFDLISETSTTNLVEMSRFRNSYALIISDLDIWPRTPDVICRIVCAEP
jgi:hypothetical protein